MVQVGSRHCVATQASNGTAALVYPHCDFAQVVAAPHTPAALKKKKTRMGELRRAISAAQALHAVHSKPITEKDGMSYTCDSLLPLCECLGK